MCLIMARTFSYRHSLDCVTVLSRKQEDINPNYLAHYSLDKIKFAFVVLFLVFSVQQCLHCHCYETDAS